MRLIFNYLKIHFKIAMEYKLSFYLLFFAQVQFLFIDLFVVNSLLDKFKLFDKYNFNEIVLGFSAIWLGFSIVEAFGRGFDEFNKLIVKGGFDILLIRPRNIYLQIFGSSIEYAKMSRVLGSLVLFIIFGIRVVNGWTILKVLLLFFMVIASVVIILSLFIIGASLCFKTIQGLEFFNVFTYGTKQISEYPMDIFDRPFKIFFTYIIPITIINYYPLDYLAGRNSNIIFVFLPLLTFIMLLISVLIFNRSVKNYCSTGS